MDRPQRGTQVASVPFDASSLRRVRREVADRAQREGVGPSLTRDFALAVHELAANSVIHGGGSGVVRLWSGGGRVHCEVEDHGARWDPTAGTAAPSADAESGRGLWLVRQLCEGVDVSTTPLGTVVRVSMAVGR